MLHRQLHCIKVVNVHNFPLRLADTVSGTQPSRIALIDYKTSMTTYQDPLRGFGDNQGLKFSHALPVVVERSRHLLASKRFVNFTQISQPDSNQSTQLSLQVLEGPWALS